MKLKLKQSFKASEIVALQKHLARVMVSVSVAELRQNPSDLLILSALYELYAKVKPLAENVRLFPSKRSDELYSLTLTRTQAVALWCVDRPEGDTYETAVVDVLLGVIHQAFIV